MSARAASSFVAVLLVAAVAHAQAPSPADVAFQQGRELLKAGKYAEACEQFEKSEQLDPELGTKFNIAQCDEKIGKVASALAIYRELADHDTNARRKAASAQLAQQLAAQVPKLVVQVSGAHAHAAVTLAGASGSRAIEPDQPVELDLGDYTVSVRSEGMTEYTGKVSIRDPGRTISLAVVLVPVKAEVAVTKPPPPRPAVVPVPKPEPAAPRSHRKLYALGAIGAGGASVVTGLVFGVLASGKWSDAKKACGGGTTCATPDALARANSLRSTARTDATLSTVFVIAGLAVAGGGAALWLTSPHEHAVQISASATTDSAGFVVSGRF